MPLNNEVTAFVGSVFGSIWSLELLLILQSRPDHAWGSEELIAALRGSELVLARSSADLLAANLIETNGTTYRYAPASAELGAMVKRLASLYASRPAVVRRLIVGGGEDLATRFADAFRFRRPES
jgi:riboflavin biosynthesis pyrimidine reductase